ncbi:pickpocket protein 19 [Eurosta solidaginis]|uniref:pickpocket protein 19 n=1 Tax=Eurosta solidaginis TaxID=178769 RepID=UPI00353097A9
MVNPIRFPASQTAASKPQEPTRTTHRLPSWKTIRRAANEFSAAAWELAFRFGQSTTIHGVNRLFSRRAGKYERFVWFLTVMFALLGAVYVSNLLSKRFSEGKLETVVDSTRWPVYHITFPTVSICNNNQLNWDRIAEAKRKFLPMNSPTEQQQNFEQIVASYDNVKFADFLGFLSLQNMSIGALNKMNFTEVVEFMTWRCEELLSQCVWNHFEKNCCEIFSLRRSKNGFCWTFNSIETDQGRQMEKDDPLWPWHLGSAGPGSGLAVRVFPNAKKHYPKSKNDKGLSIMVAEPGVWHKDAMNVPENTQTMLEIEPVVYYFDNNTRGLDISTRQCIFKDEKYDQQIQTLHYYDYMIENCQSECHQQYLLEYCNCTLDLLFPPGPYRSCTTEDLLCLAENNDRFLYSHTEEEKQYVRNYHKGMVCNCLRNCYSLNYLADVRPQFLSAEGLGNQSFVDLDVHFRFETMMVYRTSLIFGWVDFIVAFGGIAGLFLGCSLISTMELAYFLLVDLPTFILQKYRNNKNKSEKLSQSANTLLEVKNNFKQIQYLDVKSQLIQPQSYNHLFYNTKFNKEMQHFENWKTNLAKINY